MRSPSDRFFLIPIKLQLTRDRIASPRDHYAITMQALHDHLRNHYAIAAQ
jgi:hypothetical protein